MLIQLPEISIQKIETRDQPCLRFTFRNKFTEQAAIAGTKVWNEELNKHPECTYQFIWDCTEMTGFEISARREWYKYMAIHKHRISRVTTISGNIMIRSAAKVMLELFGIPCKTEKPLISRRNRIQRF
ncbi:hypothetical protein [Marinoscillum furvescens]|uniref:Uncharacterized protein n=1 Tax=Marinoscillum furvescens DSM 4134 TaxID=1122208 RepID=A0A3D9L0I8_MARFU|nr:hypothetical protein [Marinoscillum furvescens]RED93405.1 hypothetical protein C7460_12550 [Marinoscillum furvescens DSM 4134]